MQTYRTVTPEIEHQHLVDDNESANANMTAAAKDAERLRDESMRVFTDYYDKILFYSAGAFSFTLALVNLVSQSGKILALTKISVYVPNVYFLYLSWVCYLTTCVLIICARKLHAIYLGYAGMAYYAEKVKDFRLTQANLVSSPIAQIFSVTGFTNAAEKLSEDAKMIEKQEIKNKEKAELFYKLKMTLSNLSEILALLATILLLIFSIFVTQGFLWN